jgi:hypothetical protein
VKRERDQKAKMKARKKKIQPAHSFVFNQEFPQNVLRLQHDEVGVIITATRDNFSDRDKAFFVRHLAAEGFLDDEAGSSSESIRFEANLRWEIECSPSANSAGLPGQQRRTNRFVTQLLIGGLLLWLLELSILFLARL